MDVALDQDSAEIRKGWPQLSPPEAWTWARIRQVSGHVVECDGLQAPLGAMCEIETDAPDAPNVAAEVVAFSDDTLKLIPFSETVGISRDSRIRLVNRRIGLPVGEYLLGRVIDPLGNPLDSKPLVAPRFAANFFGRSVPALLRKPCLLYTSPSPRDATLSRMPSSA